MSKGDKRSGNREAEELRKEKLKVVTSAFQKASTSPLLGAKKAK